VQWRKGFIVWALLAALVLLWAVPASAASVESLLMPGPVAAKHAKYEQQCTNCHDRANRARQSELCMACHKEIAADVQQRTGYHGRMPNAGAAGQCQACHSEHLGRNADIVRLDTAQFDHARTDFRIEGAHRALACASCHQSGEAFRKASATCLGCHKSDDYHDGQLGTACADCHSQNSWAGGRYDHDKTRFSLNGAHETLACGACHLGGRYQEAPRSCVGCHATDDVHRGERGEDCGSCHTTRDWRTAKFDHEKETGFALLGQHARLTCQGCHRSGRFDDDLPKDCAGCHRADDSHAGRFGEQCSDCHGNDAWKPVQYDHAARAKFALLGAHARIDCHACHTGTVAEQKIGSDCSSCHQALDPHGGKLSGGCDSCHSQERWRDDILFDHDLTEYPLLGLHTVVSCAQCHRTLDFSSAPTGCNDCHQSQDVHKGGLGAKCDSCHSPNGWSIWDFDHAKQTGFALAGAHRNVNCAGCHRDSPGSVKMSGDCVSCHRQDDRHLGQFGLQCQRCHTTWTFKGARIQ
jgi:hypothetical protein